ncbi:MAG TPA: hypothetical protein VHS34_07355 [Terriglobales bacterium]|jgi:hypothetical protein|nr:hypothetical protein [Terriglobales bacterium]
MAKKIVPIRVSPRSLRCPFCDARPGKHCETNNGNNLRNIVGTRIALMHVARIKKAAEMELSPASL